MLNINVEIDSVTGMNCISVTKVESKGHQEIRIINQDMVYV